MKRIALLLIFLFSLSFGDTLTYVVPNFLGGINVAMDSVDIAPNEAVDITNLTLDMPNCLSARHGYTVWNSTQINNADIKGIFIYEPYAGTYRVVVACSNYVYIYPGLSGEDSVTNWQPKRMCRGKYLFNLHRADTSIYRTTDNYHPNYYSYVGKNDKIILSNYEYTITNSYLYKDSVLRITSDSVPRTDSTKIIKWFQGRPRFSQYQDKLYITDSLGFALVYNDTTYQYLAVVDTGVTDSIITNSDSSIVASGRGNFYQFAKRLLTTTGSRGAKDTANSGLILKMLNTGGYGKWGYYITNIDSCGLDTTYVNGAITINTIYYTGLQIGVSRPLETYWKYSNYIGTNYWVLQNLFKCNSDAKYRVLDNSKSFIDIAYGDEYLSNYWAVYRMAYPTRIYCNGDSSYSVKDSVLRNHWGYYIFSSLPHSGATDTLQSPRFSQIEFYNDRLYAFGYDSSSSRWNGHEYVSGAWRNHQNRIWYSEIAMPYMIKWDYNFDLPDNTPITRMFQLRDRLYIATGTKIYSYSGEPGTFKINGDQSLSPVLTNNGIPNYDSWINATTEVGFFLNSNGLYEFNGVNARKISQKVDPLLERYSRSRKVLGYFKDKLYVSYPDSNVTLVFYPEYDYACVKLGFGMTAFATIPKDTSLFLCGINSQKGYVCSYPNAGYTDILADGSASWYNFNYTTGWQSLNPEADFTVNKKLIRAYIPLSNASGTDLDVYASMVNPDTIAMNCDTTYAYPFVWVPYFNNRCYGEYFKLRFYGSSSAVTILRGYRIQWEPYQGLRK